MLPNECVNNGCTDCQLANCLCPCHTDADQLRPGGRDRRESWRRVIFLAPPADICDPR